jgi:phosphopantothenoylcysteine decarboxylase
MVKPFARFSLFPLAVLGMALRAAGGFPRCCGGHESTKKNCLLGCSGSVATLKVPELAIELNRRGYNVIIVCTEKSKFFLNKAKDYNSSIWQAFEEIGGNRLVLEDKDEWQDWTNKNSIVLHIELRKWADMIIIAPGSADLISKAAVGISDNLLLSIMRAWDFSKPAYICPAMNTLMWSHPTTMLTLNKLTSYGWKIIDPVVKVLACKDVGVGAMAEVSTIINVACSHSVNYTSSFMYLYSKFNDIVNKVIIKLSTANNSSRDAVSTVSGTSSIPIYKLILYSGLAGFSFSIGIVGSIIFVSLSLDWMQGSNYAYDVHTLTSV